MSGGKHDAAIAPLLWTGAATANRIPGSLAHARRPRYEVTLSLERSLQELVEERGWVMEIFRCRRLNFWRASLMIHIPDDCKNGGYWEIIGAFGKEETSDPEKAEDLLYADIGRQLRDFLTRGKLPRKLLTEEGELL